MDVKIIFAGLGIILSFISMIAYTHDILKRPTRPHTYTWLIWIITQGTATAGVWFGGGHWGALNLTIGVAWVTFIFLLSLRYGTKNITRFDTIILIVALAAIVVWWKLRQPVLAVLMVSFIDLLGYIPSFRKSFYEPWSETLITWIGFIVGNIFAIMALREYNLLTLSYLVTINTANIIMVIICLSRRSLIPPQKQYV